MPGQPLRRAVHAELQRRANAELGADANALDYGEHWTASGRTFVELANELAAVLALPVSRETVRAAVYSDESEDGEAERRLRSARARGAHTMVETAIEIVDDATVHRDHLAKAKMRADLRERVAGKWNREEYGETKQPLLTLNVGSLHLDSLRRSSVTTGTSNPLQVKAPDVEVLASEDVSTSVTANDTDRSTE